MLFADLQCWFTVKPEKKERKKRRKHASPVVKKLRFSRVVFGVSASPFLLNATTFRSIVVSIQTSEHVDESIYVDDVTYGADSEGEAYKLYEGVCRGWIQFTEVCNKLSHLAAENSI